MTLYDIIFYFFAVVILSSGIFLVLTKNIVYSAFSLMFTLFGIAGLYILLGADFIGIVQLIVYVGGILILILFGVMLTNKITNVQIKTGVIHMIPAIIGVGVFTGYLINVLFNTKWQSASSAISQQSTVYDLGRLLITDYVLIFELLGILLLVALIGAATIARKDK